MTIAMLLVGLCTVASGAGVVFAHKTLNSALCLVATLFLIAVHFALLHADFLAALQIMVYAGAIMVLVVFVIMLLGLREPNRTDRLLVRHYVGVVFLGLFVAALIYVQDRTLDSSTGLAGSGLFGGGSRVAHTAEELDALGSPISVGRALYTKYLFGLELVSVLLLAGIVGAVVLAHDPRRPLAAGRGLRAKRVDLDVDARSAEENRSPADEDAERRVANAGT